MGKSTKPTIDLKAGSDTGISSSDNVTRDLTPTLTGSAAAGATVTIRDGKLVLGTVTANKAGHWSFTADHLDQGVHHLTAAVGSDKQAMSKGLDIRIDKTTPSRPTLDLATTSDSGAFASDDLTRDKTPTLSGIAEKHAIVTIRDGSHVLGTVIANAAGHWSFTAKELTDGHHRLSATATDAAGNVSKASAALKAAIDTKAPTAPTVDLAAASDSGSSSTDRLTNDSTPTLSGTAEAGSTVTIKDGATVLGTATANGSGIWTFTTTALGDGQHTLTATVIDKAGNTSTASTALVVAIDTDAPDAPTIDLDAGSDTGVSSTDDLTNESTPTLSGTAEAGSAVTIKDGSTVLGTATANGSGIWKFTTIALDDGQHTLTATATDKAGNVSGASDALVVAIDTMTQAPTVDLAIGSDTGGSSTDDLTNESTPTLTGTAEAGSTVTIKDGSTVLGTATASGSGTWTFTTTALDDGQHTLTATAIDKAGNTSTASTALVVAIDTDAPEAPTIDLDAGSDTGGVSTDNITADTTPTLSGTAEAGSTVTIKDGSTVLGTAIANGSGIWTFTTIALDDGQHTLTATATDKAGNVSGASDALVVAIDTMTQAPTVDLDIGSNTGVSTTDDLTNESTPTLTGTAEAGSTVTIKDGTTVLGTATANGSGIWTFTTTALDDGQHTLTATATDTAGNVSGASTALVVAIDTMTPAPTVDLDAGSDTGGSSTDDLTNEFTPTLTGTAEAGSTVTIKDGTTVLGTATANGSGIWTFTTTALDDGQHTLTATATDKAGNVNAVSTTLAVTVDTMTPAPTVDLDAGSDTGVSSTDDLTNDATPTLSGAAEAGSTVTIKDGTTVLGTVTADGSGTWTFTTAALDDRQHTLTATAIDKAGNPSTASTALVVAIDRDAPDAPTIDLDAGSDTGGVSTDNITADTTPTLSGTAEAGSTVTIKDGSAVLGTATANGSGAWTYTTTALDDGQHTLTATATDTAGNTSTESMALVVTIDTMTPAPTVDLDAGSDTGVSSTDDLTNDATPTLSGAAEAGSTVTIKDDTTVLGTVTADGSGTWTFTTAALDDGDHSLTAVQTDMAGNVSAVSATLALTIDTGAPQIPTIDLDAGSDTGTSSTDDLTKDTTQTLTGTAEAGSIVTIKDGSTTPGTVTADHLGAWTFTTAALSDGIHSLKVVATDVAGNASTASTALAVTIDTDAPDAPAIELVNDDGTPGDLVSTGAALRGTAEAGAIVAVYIDGSSTADGTAIADSSGAWIYLPVAALSPGSHAFTAIATDAAGNSSIGSALAMTLSSRVIFDLSFLQPSQGFIIQGDTVGDRAGFSVASAGDVNGDGFNDIIVGAMSGDDGGNLAGEAYVVFGTASGFGAIDGSGRQVIDLTTLTAAGGFIIQGDAAYDRAGWSVASAGDVNGDGFDDVIVGALFGSDGGANAGEAYVVFGTASGFGATNGSGRQVIDLATLTAVGGFIIQGDAAYDFAGVSVASAGDVNGDGFDDLIVGAFRGDDGGSYAGEAYVVFGTASGFGTTDGSGRQVIDLSTLTAAGGFIIQGDTAFDYAGWSVASAGDINGDGFDDIIVGAYGGDDGGNLAGEAYVVFGTSSGFGTTDGGGRQVIDLTTLTAAQGFIIIGNGAHDQAGFSVASAGDINGDGFDDIIVAAIGGDGGGYNAGEAYVAFGTASGFGTDDGSGRQVIDLTTLTAAQGFIIQGDAAGERAGRSVASAGDVNGDGFDDIIVGVNRGNDGGSYAGEAYLVFGTASAFGATDGDGRQVIDLTTLTAAQGFIIQGDATGDKAGYSVASAGDVNGDGFDDIIVGATDGDGGGNLAGEAYILYGSAFGGLSTTISVNGSLAADTLIGGRGGDMLSGGGGADVLIGGAGDDSLAIADAGFTRIRGGGGVDTLAFSGSGMTVDLTAIADNRINGIERLDLTGSGDNIATLSASDLFHFSTNKDSSFAAATLDEALVVFGNGGDVLNLEDTSLGVTGLWTQTGNDAGLDGSSAGDYDIYTYTVSGSVRGFIAVDADVTVNMI